MTQKKTRTAGERIDEMTDKIGEVASELSDKLETSAEETKKFAKWVCKWREKAPIEEVVTTVLGIVFLCLALWELRGFIWGTLLLLIGILCVSGYFNSFLKTGIEWIKGQSKKRNSREKISE